MHIFRSFRCTYVGISEVTYHLSFFSVHRIMTWATGAAVAVRHERRRHEKRSTAACPRPTELNLPTSPMSYSSSPILPQTSPSGGVGIPEIYICKVSLLTLSKRVSQRHVTVSGLTDKSIYIYTYCG